MTKQKSNPVQVVLSMLIMYSLVAWCSRLDSLPWTLPYPDLTWETPAWVKVARWVMR